MEVNAFFIFEFLCMRLEFLISVLVKHTHPSKSEYLMSDSNLSFCVLRFFMQHAMPLLCAITSSGTGNAGRGVWGFLTLTFSLYIQLSTLIPASFRIYIIICASASIFLYGLSIYNKSTHIYRNSTHICRSIS